MTSMKQSEVIKILEKEKWTRADALRAIDSIDFDTDPDELTIYRSIVLFAGSELNERQRKQAAQKGMVTKKNNALDSQKQQFSIVIEKFGEQKQELDKKLKDADVEREKLIEINNLLKQDNKYLKNLIDAIRLELTQNLYVILKSKNSDIRQAVAKLIKSTLG